MDHDLDTPVDEGVMPQVEPVPAEDFDPADDTRTARARMRRDHLARLLKRLAGVVVSVAVLAGLLVVGWFALSAPKRWIRTASTPTPVRAASRSLVASATVQAVATQVEVPDLVGMPLRQARAVISAAGLVASIRVDATFPAEGAQSVRDQAPSAGLVVSAGSTLTVSVPRPGALKAAKAKRKTPFVVVIDAGHQSHGDAAMEPVGPGSKDMQAKATAGSNGVVTAIPEYEIDLQIATNLKDRLEAAGIKVVMTRTTNDVDLSNVDRAQIANKSKADLFVRVHADSSVDSTMTGVSVTYPAQARWTKSISSASHRAAIAIDNALVASTGAQDGGVLARGDVTGFNWSKVPAVLVEVGHQSNPVEDRLLSSSRYQDQLGQGMAQGVLGFLEGGK